MLQTHANPTPLPKGRTSLVIIAILAWMAVWPGLARAQPSPPAPTPAPLMENATDVLPKTVIYGVMAAAVDVAIGSIITGDVVSGTAMAVVASGSSWLLYQVHEMAWNQMPPTDRPVATRTTTFAVANVLRLFGVGMLFTGNVVLSGTFVVLDGFGEVVAYVATDGIWKYVVQPLATTVPSGRGRAVTGGG